MPHMQNHEFDSLVMVAWRLSPLEDFYKWKFFVDFIFRPLIPDILSNWRLFDDDYQVIQLLTSKDAFKDYNQRQVE